MPDDGRADRNDGEPEEDDLKRLFPDLPHAPEVPEAPRLDSVTETVKDVTNMDAHAVQEAPRLAPVSRPIKPGAQKPAIAPGSYNKAALASTAATAFIMPTIVLALVGYVLDQKLHTNYLAFIGVVLGLVVGISALMKIVKRLE
jgi:F0F1-type ATP synthase assembly protein I